jgi:hypothetical protein
MEMRLQGRRRGGIPFLAFFLPILSLSRFVLFLLLSLRLPSLTVFHIKEAIIDMEGRKDRKSLWRLRDYVPDKSSDAVSERERLAIASSATTKPRKPSPNQRSRQTKKTATTALAPVIGDGVQQQPIAPPLEGKKRRASARQDTKHTQSVGGATQTSVTSASLSTATPQHKRRKTLATEKDHHQPVIP